MFGDPDESHTAAYKLRQLKQNRDTAEYAAEFQNLIGILRWGDDEKIRADYINGLKDHVKDGLLYHADPTNLNDLINLTIKIDTRWFQREKEKKGTTTPSAPRNPPAAPRQPFQPRVPVLFNNNPFQQRPPNPFRPQATNPFRNGAAGMTTFTGARIPPTPRLNQPAPGYVVPGQPIQPKIENASGSHGRISTDERKYRLDNKLCLYCGQKGHIATDHYVRSIAANGETYDYHVPDYQHAIAGIESGQVQPAHADKGKGTAEYEEASKNPFHGRS